MSISVLRTRLAKAKAAAAKNGYAFVKAENTLRPSDDWRVHASGRMIIRSAGTWQPLDDMPHYASADSRAYYCDAWPAGFRHVGTAHDVCRSEHSRRVDHDGWYTDSFQDGTLIGHVLQLPGHKGKPVFIPGTAHSDWDGVTLYPLDMHDNPLDCASAADHYAEHGAESAREDDARFQAEQAIEQLRESIATMRADARALIREMKLARRVDATRYPAICATLRASLAGVREDSRKAYKQIAKLQDNYWYAVES